MGWLSGWNYRKKVTISGSSGAGQNYQVKLSIGSSSGGDFHLEGHCEDFPNDIRFTDDDGETLLDYWIEDPTQDPITVWVEVKDSLDNDVDIYCYYGKSGVSSGSDGDSVFEFFDDFEDGVIDSSKWGVAGKTENVVEEDGVLKITHAGTANPVVYGKTDFSYGYSMRLRVKYLQTNKDVEHGWSACTGAGAYLCACGGENGATYFPYRDTTVWLRNKKDGVKTQTNVLSSYDTNFHVWELVRNSASKVSLYKDDDYVFSHTTNVPTIDLHPAFDSGSSSYGGNSEIDWLLVRKYADPEPTFSSAGAEETAIVFLEGTSSGLTTTTALLARILQILSVSPVTSNISGVLTGLILLSGSTSPVSTTLGLISRLFSISGTSLSSSTVDSTLTLPIYLIGTTSSASTTQALILRLRSITSLTSGVSSITGSIILTRSLFSTVPVTSTSVGLLTSDISLFGSSVTTASASSILSSLLSISGTSSGFSTLISAPHTILSLTSTIPSTSITYGDLSLLGEVSLSGTSSALSTTSATFRRTTPLLGSSPAQSSLANTLLLTISILGTTSSSSSLTSIFSRILTLLGSSLPTFSLTGSLTITIPFITLAGTTSGVSTSIGALSQSYALTGHISSASTCTLSVYVPYVWTDTKIEPVTKRLRINFEV